MSYRQTATLTTATVSEAQAYTAAIQHGFALLPSAIDDTRLKTALRHAACGALVTFEGWVRNHNNTRPVKALHYHAYEQLALNQGAQLAAAAKQQFAIMDAVAVHRVGELAIGDMAIWIGITAAHRQPAFAACEWLLNAIKADVAIWKQEFYHDSDTALWLSNNG